MQAVTPFPLQSPAPSLHVNIRSDLDLAGNFLAKNGSGGRDRTYDLVINSHPLCR